MSEYERDSMYGANRCYIWHQSHEVNKSFIPEMVKLICTVTFRLIQVRQCNITRISCKYHITFYFISFQFSSFNCTYHKYCTSLEMYMYIGCWCSIESFVTAIGMAIYFRRRIVMVFSSCSPDTGSTKPNIGLAYSAQYEAYWPQSSRASILSRSELNEISTWPHKSSFSTAYTRMLQYFPVLYFISVSFYREFFVVVDFFDAPVS